jgi:hypothetical protein
MNKISSIFAKSARVLSDELITALDKLQCQGNGRKWNSVQQALKGLWGRERIEALPKRLDGFRQQLVLNILVSLRYGTLNQPPVC